jgi:hypothetical protein
VFAVAFKVTVPEGVASGGAGTTQLVWQFADCELHDIMQFVTVEVTGDESPVKGVATFGVVACASRIFPSAKAPGVLEQTAAATTRIARPSMTCPPIREEYSSIAELGVVRTQASLRLVLAAWRCSPQCGGLSSVLKYALRILAGGCVGG